MTTGRPLSCGIAQQLHGREESVHVEMGDAALGSHAVFCSLTKPGLRVKSGGTYRSIKMQRWIKWTAGVVGGVAVLAGAAAVLGLQLADRKMARKVEVTVKPVAYASDPQALERGKYLFQSRGCVDCHGANGGGREFVNDGKGVRMAGANITPGGVTAGYKPEDWVRTIRHGVQPGGRALMVMPSEDYNRFTDQDLAALVSYVRSLPPQSGGAAVVEFPTPVRILYGFGGHPGRGRQDRSFPAAGAAGPGGRQCAARRLCGQYVHRLPWRAPVRRQDPGRPA